MQFYGEIQGLPIKVLVDSGSTTSFISQQIADQLPSLVLKPAQHQVQVANGGLLQCTAIALDCCWTMDSQSFTHHLKILPLHAYDLIVGMDWLERFSPMKVDWKCKWMQTLVGTDTVVLHGCPDLRSPELMFLLLTVQSKNSATREVPPMPSDIQQILDDFPNVCAPLTKLPPV